MKYIVACDSFKGSLSSQKANSLIQEAILDVSKESEIHTFLMSDGGEGFLKMIQQYVVGGKVYRATVHDVLGRECVASYYLKQTTAYIESAEVIGIEKIARKHLNVSKATSYGLGELIIDAYQNGATNFIIGLGGSATSDLGVGVLQAFGCEVFDTQDELLPIWQNNQFYVNRIQLSPLFEQIKICSFTIVSDIESCLTGETGAARMFSRQKGASEEEQKQLEKTALAVARVYEQNGGQRARNHKGAGAAGGLGCLFQSLFCAKVHLGGQWFIEISHIAEYMQKGVVLITGEGSIDSQTLSGKGPGVLAKMAKEQEMTVIGVGGSVSQQLSAQPLFDALFSIQTRPRSFEEAIREDITRSQLCFVVKQIVHLLER